MRSTEKCTVPGCERHQHGLGMCKMHHQRWRRTGSAGEAAPSKPSTRTKSRDEPSVFCSKCGERGVFGTYEAKGHTYYRRFCNKCVTKKSIDWRMRNPDRYRATNRAYMKKFRDSGYYEKHPEKRQNSKAWGRVNPERFLFNAMQRRYNYKKRLGKTNGIDRYLLKMTFDEFVDEIGGAVPTTCPVLGIPLRISNEPFRDHLPTIDRIDASRPYERGNIAVMSWRANIIKSVGTAKEHRRVALWMDRLQRRKKTMSKEDRSTDSLFAALDGQAAT